MIRREFCCCATSLKLSSHIKQCLGGNLERSNFIFAVALRLFTRGTVHTMCSYLIFVAVVVRRGTERLSDLHQKNSV